MDPIFSVSEFNEMIGSHLALLGEVTVEGELSEFKISQGKWIYATLKDEGASVNVFATIYKIHNFRSLDVGMQVKVVGTAGLYKKTARFSLNADEILPSGEGALLAAYEKLKAQLLSEGLFDESRKRPLPQFPERIGLLTARDSQAYQDFVKVSAERIGGFKIYFYPVNVQGAGAVDSVLAGVQYFNNQKNVDVIVVTRGGGSLEDLAAFNDERLVRAVYGSSIPTVCAIGHEGDVSLIELAADVRGSTPSNAAELIFRDRTAVLREIESMGDFIATSLESTIENIERATLVSLNSISGFLDRSVNQITLCLHSFTHAYTRTALKLENVMQYVEEKNQQLSNNIENWLHLFSERIGYTEDKLRTLDPTAILKRGFSIVKNKSGQIIRSVDTIALGDEASIVLLDGVVTSKVINIKKESHDRQ